MSFIVTPDAASVAGAIVWWELSGAVDLDDFVEVLQARGFPEKDFPSAPGVEAIAQRALQGAVKTKRQLVRPLRERGRWDLIEESVGTDAAESVELGYTPLLRVEALDDGQIRVTPRDPTTGEALAEIVRASIRFHEKTLTAADISLWLLAAARRLDAVSLRERGGFYFIPAPQLPAWMAARDALRDVSAHQIREMPAMRTEEAVEAVLSGLRTEACAKMAAFEEYLKGDVSTRGLNAAERDLGFLAEKVSRYSELLGVSLTDLSTRHEALSGAVVAARLSVPTRT